MDYLYLASAIIQFTLRQGACGAVRRFIKRAAFTSMFVCVHFLAASCGWQTMRARLHDVRLLWLLARNTPHSPHQCLHSADALLFLSAAGRLIKRMLIIAQSDVIECAPSIHTHKSGVKVGIWGRKRNSVNICSHCCFQIKINI